MTKHHKPVAGSQGFWPKKRAARMYPRLRISGHYAKALPLGFAAYKAGMANTLYTDSRKDSSTRGMEVAMPVTILDAPPLKVAGIKLYASSAYGLKDSTTILAETVSKDLSRKTSAKPKGTKEKLEKAEKSLSSYAEIRLLVHTQPRMSGMGKKRPELFEVPLGGKPEEQWKYAKDRLGTEIQAKDVFEEGEFIDVIAIDKGKGTQGAVKRFGIKIRPRKSEGKRRHVGSLGPWHPARVLPGKIALPGQLGFQTRTEYNKRIIALGTDGLSPKSGWEHYGLVKGNYIMLAGSVPGSRKRLIMLRKASRPPKKVDKVQVKEIVLG